MCTVSFVARQRGYLLAMNRDEKLSRAKGLPPRPISVEGRTVLCPSEPGGGTWIALNDTGAAFALVNWYSVKSDVKTNPFSRGGIVKAISAQTSAVEASKILEQLPLRQVNPFRLIGIFSKQKEIVEWRWDLSALVCQKRPWKTQQWISSGHDEPQAQRVRSKTFRAAFRQKSAGSSTWLRRLHRSHTPACGPFSTCMHRADAATVSYTEIAVTSSRTEMFYYPDAPCQCALKAKTHEHQMPLSSANHLS